MTHFTRKMSSRMSAIILTLLFSTVAVLGAVGPGYTGLAASQAMMTTAAISSGEAAALAA